MTGTDPLSPAVSVDGPDVVDAPAEPLLPAAVLWDMDGTLVDTEPYWFASERDLVDRFGHGHWPDEHAHAMVGFDLLDSAAYMQEHGGVDLPAHEIVERLLDGVIARLHRRIDWRPGARELLAALNAAGVPCVLVTMSWRRFVDPVLAALPPGSFVAAITGDEVPEGQGKPSPVPYELGAAAAGAHPADCLAIEDSPTGVRSALAAGCRVIGVPNVRALRREPGLVVIESLEGVRVDDLARVMTAPIERDPDQLPFSVTPRTVAIVAAVVVTLAAIVWFVTRSDEPSPPALPPGAVAVDVWAPYWTLDDTLSEIELRFGEVREMSPFWFGARGVDEIVVDENAPDLASRQFIDEIAERGPLLVPSIVDQTASGEMAAILADPDTRAAHIDTILEFADDLDVDGIDIDYENFAFVDDRATWLETRPNWVAFVEELGDALRDDGRTLSVSIPPVWGFSERIDIDGPDAEIPSIRQAQGFWVYDHAAIAEHVDALRIMAYDYSVPDAGPIAPIWWVDDLVTTLSALVPEEFHDRLVLGVPPYGRNWVVSTLGECPDDATGRTNVFARSVLDLAELRDATPQFDATTSEWFFDYALEVESGDESCIQNRRVHWVDAEGVAARTEVARRAGWGGVALWALGYEDDEVWSALIDASRRPLAASTESG